LHDDIDRLRKRKKCRRSYSVTTFAWFWFNSYKFIWNIYIYRKYFSI